MPKTSITEDDIQDMARQGKKSLEVGPNVVLTALAYEAAEKNGIVLLEPGGNPPPAAPVRPYLSEVPPAKTDRVGQFGSPVSQPGPSFPVPAPVSTKPVSRAGLEERIRAAVNSQLGKPINRELLDRIIQRVLNATGLR